MEIRTPSFFIARQCREGEKIILQIFKMLRVDSVLSMLRWLIQLLISIKTCSLQQIRPALKRPLILFHNLLLLRWMTYSCLNLRHKKWRLHWIKWPPWKPRGSMECLPFFTKAISLFWAVMSHNPFCFTWIRAPYLKHFVTPSSHWSLR